MMSEGLRGANVRGLSTQSEADRVADEPKTPSRFYLITKQAFDYAVSAIAIALLAPLMLLTAVLIRLDTPGPALFRQQRVGKDGKLFTILKFRSMYLEAPKYSMVRRENAMVTRMGRFLRRTSLDELPQLFNVIRGEMSLIGPRPEQPFLVEQYEPWQHRRHVVKPGITGWWQVNGRNELPMQENTEYDIYYVDNLSLLLDLKILLLTVREVMRRRGAY